MPIESEGKFLVTGDSWLRDAGGTLFRQGGLGTDPERTMRLRPLIEKTRYLVHPADRVWTMDEFLDENAGLILADVELEGADARLGGARSIRRYPRLQRQPGAVPLFDLAESDGVNRWRPAPPGSIVSRE